MSEPILSVVILEYHSIDDLRKCIKSLNDKLPFSFQCTISCNSEYNEQTQSELKKEFPEHQWVFNKKNLGFAGGVNAGLAVVEAPYILLLNVDGLLLEGIEEAISLLKKSSNIGIIGPRILNSDGVLQDSFRKFLSPYKLIYRTAIRVIKKENASLFDYPIYSEPTDVDWVIGGAMLVSKEGLEKVGFLDDNYFLYVEDMDWCMRFWRNGYRVVWHPSWKVNYSGDRKSVSSLSKQKKVSRHTLYHLKSYLRFLLKFGFSWKRPKQQIW